MKFVPKLKHLVFFSVIGFVICFDQLTKQYIIAHFKFQESLPVINDFFSITYVRNTGAAFGILSTWDPAYRIPFFIVVPLIALGFVWYLFRQIKETDILGATVLAAIVGGAIGNLIDRVVYNYVIDFLDFYWGILGPHFPAFNVADIAICIGVFFLMIDSYIIEKRSQKDASHSN